MPTRTPSSPRRPGATRPGAASRRLALLRAACAIIADRGFEGLRTRAVAARAKVNIATLHYYFPTKEALIGGVAEHMSTLFSTVRAPAPPAERGTPGPLVALRRELADVRYYWATHRQSLEVMMELTRRAQRDPAVRRAIRPLNERWYRSIHDVIVAGQRERVFRTDVGADALATLVVTFLAGVPLLDLDAPTFDQACAALERLLVRAPTRHKTGD
jgi:AcrR family transcriptional regulator